MLIKLINLTINKIKNKTKICVFITYSKLTKKESGVLNFFLFL